MKAIVFENKYDGSAPMADFHPWYVVADSALSNSGKPFYIPEYCGDAAVKVGIAVKISKLGKYIEPRFAPRYFKEYAPILHFVLPEMMKALEERKMPVSPAVSFDKSIIAGDWIPCNEDLPAINLVLELNGHNAKEWKYETDIEVLIHEFSKMNTLKMGDVIIPPLSEGIVIKQGDFLQVKSNKTSPFSVKVK